MDPFAALPTGFLAAYGIVYVLVLVLILVSMWKIFVKMGEPGWKGIIPIYNLWVLVDRLHKPKSWFWIIVIGSIAAGCLSGYVTAQSAAQMASIGYMTGGLGFVGIAVFLLAIVLLVYCIMLYHALSKAFGHGVGFTIGLILLSVVFFPILAFGPSRFLLRE